MRGRLVFHHVPELKRSLFDKKHRSGCTVQQGRTQIRYFRSGVQMFRLPAGQRQSTSDRQICYRHDHIQSRRGQPVTCISLPVYQGTREGMTLSQSLWTDLRSLSTSCQSGLHTPLIFWLRSTIVRSSYFTECPSYLFRTEFQLSLLDSRGVSRMLRAVLWIVLVLSPSD